MAEQRTRVELAVQATQPHLSLMSRMRAAVGAIAVPSLDMEGSERTQAQTSLGAGTSQRPYFFLLLAQVTLLA